jgi:hypothetical protein
MCIKLQSCFRGYRERMNSFIKALKIKEYPVIYLAKEQASYFNNILSKICKDSNNKYDFDLLS